MAASSCPRRSFVCWRSLTLWTFLLCVWTTTGSTYVVDSVSGLGRMFDGIGGLSGGGATSKLLVNYAEPYRSQILDYLFKPNFGASLNILKVEIGGDVQSTDGSESSHQHEEWDENYQRGYEWWLMIEAKKRNPGIKLYGLPWGFPGWLAGPKDSPYSLPLRTATYVTRWVNAAKQVYGLDIDYVGIWNERKYDITYIKCLRKTLDTAGYVRTQIVAADGDWGIASDVLHDSALRDAVEVLGAHYPGTLSTPQAVQTGLKLWASEDYSTFNDNVGAGCWARILNQNYVNGNITSTISWNLVASYYKDLPYGMTALMTALEPWTGNYIVESPIWITAHTTQFANTTWRYLRHGLGSGRLQEGGSYVSLVGPGGQFTMVIETMTHNHSVCIRPSLPPYSVTPQIATFQFEGPLAKLTVLNVWYSKLGFDGQPSEIFVQRNSIPVRAGRFSVVLDVDVVYTLTTVTTGVKGRYPTPPPPKPFPLPYFDNYDNYLEFSEAANFAPQQGVWEVRNTNDMLHRKVNRQVVLREPIKWCSQKGFRPINVGGNYKWTNVSVQADVLVPSVNGSSGVLLAARVDKGGCDVTSAQGLFFSVSMATGQYTLSLDLEGANVIVMGYSPIPIKFDTWYKMTLIAMGDTVEGFIGTQKAFMVVMRSTSSNGFVAMGTQSAGYADFDNLLIRDVN